MDKIIEMISGNQAILVTVVGFLLTHFAASIATATTKTKNNKWYKLLEALALVVKKAKEKK